MAIDVTKAKNLQDGPKTEEDRLYDRLQRSGVVNMHVDWAFDITYAPTREEKAKFLNELLDRIAEGDYEEIDAPTSEVDKNDVKEWVRLIADTPQEATA